MSTCQFCGNDDAAYEACLDCLGYSSDDIALGLAIVLGGNSEDWTAVATSVRAAIEGDVASANPEDDPTLFQCSLCDQWRDVRERIPDRTDYGPGDWCEDCAAKPWR